MSEPLLTTADVAHVAKLARLELTDEELATFTDQLSQVLEHASDIAALDLDGLGPTAHPFGLTNALREDVVTEVSMRDDILAAAPAVEDDRFKVGRILGEAP